MEGASPPEICKKGVEAAIAQHCDVVIFDTAGRLTIDEPLMEELDRVEELTSPENVLLVCDAMIGQESVNVARSFNERIGLTGFILTKLDGDARGGAAVSVKEATGVPIMFVGVGEGPRPPGGIPPGRPGIEDTGVRRRRRPGQGLRGGH